jgi:hypothetical protein
MYRALMIFWLVIAAVHCINLLWFFQYRNTLNDIAVIAPLLAAVTARINRDAWEAMSDDLESESK